MQNEAQFTTVPIKKTPYLQAVLDFFKEHFSQPQ